MRTLIVPAILTIFIFLSSHAQDDESLVEISRETFAKEGNIFVRLEDGKERQLTFTLSDEKPNLIDSRDLVIFVRNEKVVQEQKEYYRKKIMTVGINDFLEKEISSQKPYKDGVNNTTEIIRVDNPSVSSDGNYLFFLANHTSTTSQLIKLEISSGKWILLFSAEEYELLNSGLFKDYFLIGRNEPGAAGQMIYYYLVDQTGKKVKEFNSKESMNQFKQLIQQ
ncbi:MAG: hypothetical protein ISS19_12680 [Bacteroidales bacterium]|nr:hypothetical protein [Bacteroidales bacterium]